MHFWDFIIAKHKEKFFFEKIYSVLNQPEQNWWYWKRNRPNKRTSMPIKSCKIKSVILQSFFTTLYFKDCKHWLRITFIWLMLWIFFISRIEIFCKLKLRKIWFTNFFQKNLWQSYFWPMFPFYTSWKHQKTIFYPPWKRQKTFGFLTFSGSIEKAFWRVKGI